MMDKQLEKYYEDQFTMMATPGWKELMQHFEEMKDATDRVSPIQSEKELFVKQGELNIINVLLNWKAMVEQAHEQNKEEPTFFDKVRERVGF